MNLQEQNAVRHFGELDDTAVVSVRVAAAVKNCSLPTIWRRVREGKIKMVRDGRMARVTVGSLRASIGAAEK